jgi:hypothetical protein
MSSVSWFLLAVLTLFTLGMIIHDPHQAHRPPQLREVAQPTSVVEQVNI